MRDSLFFVERSIAGDNLLKTLLPCPTCYQRKVMTFEKVDYVALDARSIDKLAFTNGGQKRGRRFSAIFRCTEGCSSKLLVSGYCDTVAIYRQFFQRPRSPGAHEPDTSNNRKIELDILSIDFVDPVIPLFEIDPMYPDHAFQDTFRTFKLFWIDPVAAFLSLRRVAESLLIHAFFEERCTTHEDSFDEFDKNFRQLKFDDRVDNLFSSLITRRCLKALWKCGSFHSHFHGDIEAQNEINNHLLDGLVVLKKLLWISRNVGASDILVGFPELSRLEKFFSPRAQKERLRRELDLLQNYNSSRPDPLR